MQRNGGLGAVLGKFQQKGYSQQAASWVSTGENEALPQQAIDLPNFGATGAPTLLEEKRFPATTVDALKVWRAATVG